MSAIFKSKFFQKPVIIRTKGIFDNIEYYGKYEESDENFVYASNVLRGGISRFSEYSKGILIPIENIAAIEVLNEKTTEKYYERLVKLHMPL